MRMVSLPSTQDGRAYVAVAIALGLSYIIGKTAFEGSIPFTIGIAALFVASIEFLLRVRFYIEPELLVVREHGYLGGSFKIPKKKLLDFRVESVGSFPAIDLVSTDASIRIGPWNGVRVSRNRRALDELQARLMRWFSPV